MDNKLNNMLNNFFENVGDCSEEELNEKLQEFIEKYNNNEIEYESTNLDKAYELLEKAQNARSKKQALKLAKEAYETYPECFDAVIFLADLEEDEQKKVEILENGLIKEKERLEKEGYFEKDNIGHFYGIFETRPYIRGLNAKAIFLVTDGKLKQARDVCKEILRLNEHDNIGARYLLMAIYATLEDEKECLSLYKKYDEESFSMVFPLFVLYYKLGDDKKANDYLSKVNKLNKHLVEFFNGTMKEDKDVTPGYYERGGTSELMEYFGTYLFLIMSTSSIGKYIIENSKPAKPNKVK